MPLYIRGQTAPHPDGEPEAVSGIAPVYPLAGGQPTSEQVTIHVKKVFSQCAHTDSVTNILTPPETAPKATAIVDARIENMITASTSIKNNPANAAQSRVTVTLQYTVVTEYSDASGEVLTLSDDFHYTKSVSLYAQDGMEVIVMSTGQSLSASLNPDGSISAEVGLYIVLEVAADIQFVVTGYEAPPPPLCTPTLPISPSDWTASCQSGTFWPPWPGSTP